ncbi:retrovirus-related pol polyprotein from transposon TNT 1-94 [Tanacetum coccineum]
MGEYSQKWHNGMYSRTRSTKTSDGLAAIQAQLNNVGREIKKVNEKVYAAQVGCELCKGPHYTKDCPQKEEGKTLEEAYYTQFGAPYQPGGQYRAAGPGFYQRNNENSSYPDRRPNLEESLTKFMMSKVLQERGFGCLPNSTETNPRDQVKSISTAKADFSEIRHMGREARNVKILDAYDHILPPNEKDQGSFTLPCFIHNICFDKALVDLGASDKDKMKSHASTLIDIPVFIGSFSNLIGFTIIDNDDMTKGVVLGMKFCKKYASCQMIMRKFAHGDGCERNEDE